MAPHRLLSISTFLYLSHCCSAFNVVRDYSGTHFFDGWDFFGSWDNLTLGDVWWLNASDAFTQKLAYVNDAGHAIMKVDNTSTVPFNEKRNTVRITSKDFYDVGSLWIIDLLHIPYGCSVWPAFWTKGSLWPDDGEIDIVEGINVMPINQMALHTTAGCTHNPPPDQKGRSLEMNCATPAGCTVQETAPNSFNSGFAAAGGGVWATQFDVSGIYIWFWSRNDVPASISQATSTSSIDITQWGPPSASYPAGSNCNITQFFTPQQLVLDITLCGDWAGIGASYNATCGNSGPTGLCYPDNVVGPGSPKYDNAYFEISYVRAYSTGLPQPSPTLAVNTNGTNTVTGGSTVTTTGSPDTNPNISPLTPPTVPNTAEGSQGLLVGCALSVLVLVVSMITVLL
ncbi:hypothetical protein QCA50_013816 [Cerrena zonata]|uniref:GH16 domain-containing protein n=1 Tax=Cerrena zonata TaxID=2478898 RepID=A0AAW0FQ19_9APHY